jgi:hypothetical protein
MILSLSYECLCLSRVLIQSAATQAGDSFSDNAPELLKPFAFANMTPTDACGFLALMAYVGPPSDVVSTNTTIPGQGAPYGTSFAVTCGWPTWLSGVRISACIVALLVVAFLVVAVSRASNSVISPSVRFVAVFACEAT